MLQISISFDEIHVTSDNLAYLLEAGGCGSASAYLSIPDFHLKFLGPGTSGVFAWEQKNHQLVGLARVFTDHLFTTYISEVCVHPKYQNKGIASNLIKALITRFGHTAIFTEAFRDHVSIFTNNAIKPKEKLIACSRRPHCLIQQSIEQ